MSYYTCMTLARKKLGKQLLFFGVVGLGTLLIDLAVTTSLYTFLHFPPYLASGIGFLSGFFFNFPMNRKKVFRHSIQDRHPLRMQVLFYTALSAFNLAATALFTQLLVSTGGLKIAYAKIAVTACIAVWNFFIFKFFIFSKNKSAHDATLDERVLNDVF